MGREGGRKGRLRGFETIVITMRSAYVWAAVAACIVLIAHGGSAEAGCDWNTGDCGNGSNWLCVGLWLCGDNNPDNCGCGSGGCSNANAFQTYCIDPKNASDNICDSLGGWRDTDLRYQKSGIFNEKIGSIHYQVHPNQQTLVNQYNVKVNLFQGDYCMGSPTDPQPFAAWGAKCGGVDCEGTWQLNDYRNIKSIRPFVDNGQFPAEHGIGIKLVGFPGGHLGYPYDEITCKDDQYVKNVPGFGYECGSAVDVVWCIEPGANEWGKNYDWGENADFANDYRIPPKWMNDYGDIPIGSVLAGVYEGKDKFHCDTSWLDFCEGNTHGDSQDWCLNLRFANANGKNDDWDNLKNTMIGEAKIGMGYLCDKFGTTPFCFNTFDGSGDANDASVCANLVLQDASGAAIDEWPMFVDQVWARILKC